MKNDAGEQWIADKFAGIDLGDERLNKRARTLMARLSVKLTSSIPMARSGWGETLASYRFLANDTVSWEGILAPHWEKARQRMSAYPVVLCLQDNTEIDFNGQQIDGLGRLNYDTRVGMYLHPTLALTPQRESLGVTDAWMWEREPREGAQASSSPKESTRWLEGYERVAEMAATLPAMRLVYVADREADLVELMLRAQTLGAPADWLVRAKHNRRLLEGEKLWSHTCADAPLGEITFTMGSRHGLKAREVRQQLWARRVDVPAGKSGPVSTTCIVAREIAAPPGTKPLEWRLLTNRAAPALAGVLELIDSYRARWEIEMFFNVVKNGCRIEALQLSSIERIERALALILVVARRIAHLMRTGCTCPDLDAAQFFDPDEIQGASLLTKKKPPNRPPRLNEVLRPIATLGGFLARKGDGEPGVKTWLVLQRGMGAATMIEVLRNPDSLSCV